MNPWFLQQVSQTEKENILSKHRELYNGYQTMQPKVPNEQPLYVQDFAKDKLGATLTNDGKLVGYTNKMYEGSNKEMCSECGSEMMEGQCMECGSRGEMGEEKNMCSECGSEMMEGQCMECGSRGEMGEDTEKKEKKQSKFEKWMSKDEDSKLEKALKKFGDFLIDIEDELDGRKKKKEKEVTTEGVLDIPAIKKVFKKKEVRDRKPYEPEAIEKIVKLLKDAKTEEHLRTIMRMFNNLEEINPEMNDVYKQRVYNAYRRKADELEMYYKMNPVTETTGKLDDIYKVRDLDLKGEFDYVEGDDNYDNTFEKMHKMKKIESKETASSNAPLSYGTHYAEVIPAYDFKSDGPVGDGGTLRQKPIGSIKTPAVGLKEGGFTGGGNAPDMDLSNVDPAFNFDSDGPEEDTFTIPVEDMDLNPEYVKEPYNFVSGGGNENGGDVYPVYEEMKSAWSEEELDEVDISGAQASQTSAKKPYAFVSTGPGKGGPYQTHSWGGEQIGGYEGENEDAYWELEPNELDPDKIDRNASWEDINLMTGDDEFSNLSEDIVENFVAQKNKINEMMERMKKYN